MVSTVDILFAKMGSWYNRYGFGINKETSKQVKAGGY